MSDEKVKPPEVSVRVYREGEHVKVAFDKNIAVLSVAPEIALRMADMIKVEAVRLMRGRA